MGLGKKKSDQGEGANTGGAKKGKSNLVPAVVVAIGLVAGAKVMGGGGGDKSSTPAGISAEATTTTTEPEGERVKLDSVTLNVSDGRFLKVGITLQLRHGAKVEGGGEGKEDTAVVWAKALDLTIEVLGGKSYQELVTPAGRESAKELLLEHLDEAYHGDIETLYFTEFVMQ